MADILQVRRKSEYNRTVFSNGKKNNLCSNFDNFNFKKFKKEVLQIGFLGSSIKFSREEWTFVLLFLSVTDTVLECSVLIISEEDVLEENVENVWTPVWGFNVDVVAVVVEVVFLAVVVVVAGVAVEDDVVFPHWTCTIPPCPPAIQQI